MAIRRILLEENVGETRGVALDQNGRPVALWLDRWSDIKAERPRLGDVREARIRALDPGQRGAFADMGPGKGAAFIRLPADHGLTEGQMVRFRVEAEANRQKLPRGRLAPEGRRHLAGFEDWRARLPGGNTAVVETLAPGSDEVQAGFDDALAQQVQIPGGGAMHIERTTALTAVDIDTVGRSARGSAASRALQINMAAAMELARQCSLRALGGLVVLDCIAPINKAAGRKVRDTFLSAWSGVSLRTAKAEPPSVFGLMEASIAWGETPLDERMMEQPGQPLPETVCLEGVRSLQKALSRDTMGRLTLRLPPPAFEWFGGCDLDLAGALAEKHGARFDIVAADVKQPEVI